MGGLDENLHHTMDLDLWLRLLQARPQAVYVPRALARLRFYPGVNRDGQRVADWAGYGQRPLN